eukprot:COSAG02_NODE_212_length_28729_cov_45.980196_13_plen_98_part_00
MNVHAGTGSSGGSDGAREDSRRLHAGYRYIYRSYRQPVTHAPEPQPEEFVSLPRVEMVGVARLLEVGERWSELAQGTIELEKMTKTGNFTHSHGRNG